MHINSLARLSDSLLNLLGSYLQHLSTNINQKCYKYLVSWPSFPQHTSCGVTRWIICRSAGMGWEPQESAGSPKNLLESPRICWQPREVTPRAWAEGPPAQPGAGSRQWSQNSVRHAHCPPREGTMGFQLIFWSRMHKNPELNGICGERQLLLGAWAEFAVAVLCLGRLRAAEILVLGSISWVS